MPPHSCEIVVKTILTDKTFDMKLFIRSGLGELWTSLLDYMNLFYGPNPEKGLFGRKKYPDFKPIFQALEKVMPYVTEIQTIEPLFPTMNTVYSMWFHPDSPQITHFSALKQFFNLLPLISQTQLSIFKSSLCMMIPYSKLARNENELKSFSTISSSFQAAVDPNLPPITKEDAIEAFEQCTQFILNNFGTIPLICCPVMSDSLFQIVYQEAAVSIGYNTEIGFLNPPLEPLHQTTINMLSQLISQKIGFDLLFRNEQSSKLIMLIISSSSIFKGFKNHSQALNLLSELIPGPLAHFGKSIMFFAAKSGFDIIFSEDLPEEPASLILVAQNRFLRTLIDTIINGQLSDFGELLAHFSQTPYAYSLFLLNFLEMLVSKNDFDPGKWKFVTDLMSQTQAASSVVAYYGQYLLVQCFPELYKIEKQQALELCERHTTRKLRNRQDTPYDFLAEHIKTAFAEPNEFVRSPLHKQMKDEFSLPSYLQKLAITPIKQTADLKWTQLLDQYLHVLATFVDYPCNNNCRMGVFQALQILISTSIQMSMLPPGISFDRIVVHRLNTKRLLQAAVAQDDSRIRPLAFKLLSRIFSDSELRFYSDEEILTNFYAAIVLMMMSANDEERVLGATQAIKVVNFGFTGATMLIPILFTLIEEEEISISPFMIGLLSSFPIFAVASSFPGSFVSFVARKMQTEMSYFLPNASVLLTVEPGNLEERAIALIDEHKSEVDFLPAIFAFIANEIVLETPNRDQIKIYLDAFLDGIRKKQRETITMIRSLLSYTNRFGDIMKQEFIDFIHSVSDETIKLTMQDTTEWSYDLIRLTADCYTMSYQLIQTSDQYRQFAHFLCTINHRKKHSWAREIVEIAYDTLSLLGQFYGSYPFPGRIPTNTQATFKDDSNFPIFSAAAKGADSTILHVHDYGYDSISVNAQTNVGHFLWEFTPLNPFHEERYTPPVSLPMVEENSNLFQKQIDLSLTVNNIVDTFSVVFSDRMPLIAESCDNTDVPHYEDTDEDDYQLIRPPTNLYNQGPAALQASGRLRMDKLEQMKTLTINPAAFQRLKKAQNQDFRRGYKVGVVFVGKDKFDQNEILSTTMKDSSARFQEFITGLGCPIELKYHIGYDGGLDLLRNGTTSIFYSDFMNELMFHISPLLPTDPNDAQQIYKKRHIGNDHIHIIWCEDQRDYDTSTITSQFNQAHFVIYPLDTGLFRVDIKWRSDLEWFGPLRYPLLVTKKALPCLIRCSAIQAMNAFYQKQRQFSCPQTEIRMLKNQMMEGSEGYPPYVGLLEMMASPLTEE